MTLYDKNDVRIEDPYSISHDEETFQMLNCQRCGHTQIRQKGVVCKACNHPIPLEKPRQSWTNLQKNTPQETYREMAEVFYGDPDKPNKEFHVSRTSGYMWQVGIRNFVVTVSIAALFVVPSIMGMRAYFGESAWKVVEGKLGKWVNKERMALLKVVKKDSHESHCQSAVILSSS